MSYTPPQPSELKQFGYEQLPERCPVVPEEVASVASGYATGRAPFGAMGEQALSSVEQPAEATMTPFERTLLRCAEIARFGSNITAMRQTEIGEKPSNTLPIQDASPELPNNNVVQFKTPPANPTDLFRPNKAT